MQMGTVTAKQLKHKTDTNYKVNREFLSAAAQSCNGFTTIVNLLELCGILSVNLNQNQMLDLWTHFQDRYKITVLPEPNIQSAFTGFEIHRLFDIVCKKSLLGDALMMAVAEKHLPFVETMVTWDREHFQNKYAGNVLMPDEYMTQYA
jgi:hypothetical protein